MKTLTAAEVAEALDQVIIERGPDYVYPKEDGSGECYYSFEDGTPGCAVGAILAKVAPEAYEVLRNFEAPTDDGNGAIHRSPYGGLPKVARGVEEWADSRFESHQVVAVEDRALGRALHLLQTSQDQGDTWGEAREQFVRALRAPVPA